MATGSDVACTACMARAGESCTQPTDTGRRPVPWFHLAREGQAHIETHGLDVDGAYVLDHPAGRPGARFEVRCDEHGLASLYFGSFDGAQLRADRHNAEHHAAVA